MDPEALTAALDASRERIMSLPGVVGVGLGDAAIRVLVERADDELAALIAEVLLGVPHSITETGVIQRLDG